MEIFSYLGIGTDYVVIGLIALVLLLIILQIVQMVKHSKLKKRYEAFMKGEDGRSLETVITQRLSQIDAMRQHEKVVDNKLDIIDKFLLDTYKKMAIVKYDAFKEMGGSLSFVLALLSATNNGFIINAVHSREGCYTYVKEIIDGKCDLELAEEERRALEEAINK